MAATSQGSLGLAQNRIGVALLVAGVVTMLTLGTAFGLLAVGIEFSWVAYPVGFGGVLPIALGLVALTPPGN